MKVLLTASVLSHICQFHRPLITLLKSGGHTVHVAARDNLAEKNGLKLEEADRIYNLPFARSPLSLSNIEAYRQLKQIIDREHYDVVHCNTPVVGVLSRLAARKQRANGTKVFYTAHGFHFYKGAPWKNWVLYYPIEKYMCRYTDTLVTITEEDTLLAKKHFKVQVFHMHGVGASSKRFYPVSQEEQKRIRQRLGIPDQASVVLCTGELLPNKNQKTLLKATALLKDKLPSLRVYLAGNGPEKDELSRLANELGIGELLTMLGYRTDIDQYVKAADVIVSCSYREGLPLNIMEAMLCAKPIIASENRGHRELIQPGVSGILVPPSHPEAYAEALENLFASPSLMQAMQQSACARGALFSDTAIVQELKMLYHLSEQTA